MRRIIVILSVLALQSQIVFSQNARENENSVKSIYLRTNQSKVAIRNNEAGNFLKFQFNIPSGYEFKSLTQDSVLRRSKSGYIHERYEQYYKGIRIEYSDIRVHYAPNSRVLIDGIYIDAALIDTAIILSTARAIDKAKAYIGAEKYIWEDSAGSSWLRNRHDSASFYPQCEVVICQNHIDTQDRRFHTAYKINITASKPFSSNYVYVDVKTGNILASISMIMHATGTAETRYSGTQTITTQPKNGTYRLVDEGRKIITYNYTNYNQVDFTDNDNYWSAAEYHDDIIKDDGALDAHWGTMMAHDYFKNIHGRNAYDCKGGTIYNYVHSTLFGKENAAYWLGGMHYGDGIVGDIWASLDIVAHEFGHGIWHHGVTPSLSMSPPMPAEPGGEDKYNGDETGFIEEGLSDIWGACVKDYVNKNYGLNKNLWFWGEDILRGTPHSCVRNMQNPNDASTLSGPLPKSYHGIWWDTVSALSDPHPNSTVLSHWFYLLCEGDSSNVTGIGIDKAAAIVYLAETEYMRKETDYGWTVRHTINATNELYGHCSQEMESVKAAWDAVRLEVGNFNPNLTPVISFLVQPITDWEDDDLLLPSSGVTVGAGYTLNITGTVYCTPNAKIIVEPGGKLIVNGGVLTTEACNGQSWQGIEIIGNPNQWQNPSDNFQGVVSLSNGARIENAECGIRVGSGGIVRANDAHFINNQQAVYFAPYNGGSACMPNGKPYPNISYFKDCKFKLNNKASFSNANAQAELHRVHDISFANCTFADNRTNNRSCGAIYANSSSIIVGYVPSWIGWHGTNGYNNTECSFSGFDWAIYLKNSGHQGSRIYYNNFENNNRAIYSSGISGLIVSGCQFNMPLSNSMGIFSSKSNAYTFENNLFTATPTSINLAYGQGIVISGSGTGNHFVKSNTFHNLNIGCRASGKNSSGKEGLVFQCNSYENNYVDIFVSAGSSIRETQSGK